MEEHGPSFTVAEIHRGSDNVWHAKWIAVHPSSGKLVACVESGTDITNLTKRMSKNMVRATPIYDVQIKNALEAKAAMDAEEAKNAPTSDETLLTSEVVSEPVLEPITE